MKIIWRMVPKIRRPWQTEFFVILDRFLPFYLPNNLKNQNFEKMKKSPGDIIILHMCTINDNLKRYGSRDKPEKSKFWRTEKNIILHMCTENHDHVLFCSWDMACDRCNCYFSFWEIFCPFTPLTAQKIKILKKWKKLQEILSSYTCVPKIMIRW